MEPHIHEMITILTLRLNIIDNDITKERERIRKFTQWLIKETESEHKGLTDTQMLEKKQYVIKFRAYNAKCFKNTKTSVIHCVLNRFRKNKLVNVTKEYKRYLDLHTLEVEKLVQLRETLRTEEFYSPELDVLIHRKFATQEEINNLKRRDA